MKKHNKTEPAVNPRLKSGSAKKAKIANAMEPSEVVAELVRKLSGKVHAAEAATAGSLLKREEPAVGVGVGKAAESRQGRQPLGMNLDRLTIGLDLGDRMSNYCMVATDGEVLLEGKVKTEREAMRKLFEALSGSRVVMEVGTHSAWLEEVLEECGHEVVVANARKMEGNKKKRKKNDKEDARMLARKGRADPESLYPIVTGRSFPTRSEQLVSD
ncbi:MAG: transposase [Bryobacterales bacterium]|nr:transposase [Bryobacterales bacterium]